MSLVWIQPTIDCTARTSAQWPLRVRLSTITGAPRARKPMTRPPGVLMTLVRGAHVLRTRACATPGAVPATTAAATKATTARCGGRIIFLGALPGTPLLGVVMLAALGGRLALRGRLALGDRRSTLVVELRARVVADLQVDGGGVDELHHLGLGDLVDLLLVDRVVGGVHRRHGDVAVLAPEREVRVGVDDQRRRGSGAVRRR